MWNIITRIILRRRALLLSLIALLTAVMLYFAKNVQLSYDLAQMLPANDSTFVEYSDFKQTFGEDGNVMVVGVTDSAFFELSRFASWYRLGKSIKEIDGIEEVVSVARCINLQKNDSTNKFEYIPVFKEIPQTQEELDSLKNLIFNLPFYNNLLFNKEAHSYILAITLDKSKLNVKDRVTLVLGIQNIVEEYAANQNVEAHFSGLPFIRTVTSEKVKAELKLFVMLSLIIATVILIGLFRSFRAVIASLTVVAISVVFTLGFMSLMGYKITILTGIIPSLLIIIGIENCIFFINNYHSEYYSHGNKTKALSRIIQRIGTATFLTNSTTAAGFITFSITSTLILKEFGIVAAVNIMIEFLLSIIIIPIFFSMMPSPKQKVLKQLDYKFMNNYIEKVIGIITTKRNYVYIVVSILIAAAVVGITRTHTSGKVVDDLPSSDPVYQDLKYFESNFNGIMPFEISIDTRKKNGVMQLKNIKKIDMLQNEILKMPYFSNPLSAAELVKFAKQAYYNGNPARYSMPSQDESAFILSCISEKKQINKENPFHSFIDSTKQRTRISFQMADVGLKEMKEILAKIRPQADSIFDREKYTVSITGNSIVYTKGTEYLIKNLLQSVGLAIILISVIMALLFSSVRMIVISMIPNLIPLLLVCGIMGFAGIPVKPSTIIVFSIALGIAVDNAIHYLSRYRFELRKRNWNIAESALASLRENGKSMLSSSLVLVCGFSIFMLSGFGGTQALGILISITLFISLFCNSILLPALLLTLDKMVTTKAFRKPMVEIFDDENTESEETEQLIKVYKEEE